MRNFVYFIAALLLLNACSIVPLTGRKQILLVSDQEVLSLSNQSFSEYMKTAIPSTNAKNTALVVKVGKKMATVVESYLKSNGMAAEVSNFAWEFHLVKDSTANAFCMPGGKIVVNEGILPITQNEAGLAVVLGHEIAHAIAKHSNERMSQQMLAQYGGAILTAAMSKSTAEKQQMAQTVYGLGAQYGVMLPFSRKQESEADKMGLIFLAMAQYDLNEAVTFWGRMAQMGGVKPPEFMSTHPSDETRIADIQKNIPEAKKYQKK